MTKIFRDGLLVDQYRDSVACDFPELKIIGIHVGIPGADEMIAMAGSIKTCLSVQMLIRRNTGRKALSIT